eukprot:1512581-Amphidinium_carterae.1
MEVLDLVQVITKEYVHWRPSSNYILGGQTQAPHKTRPTIVDTAFKHAEELAREKCKPIVRAECVVVANPHAIRTAVAIQVCCVAHSEVAIAAG